MLAIVSAPAALTTADSVMRILLVDDEPVLINALRYNFERAGFEVVTADRGERALDLAYSWQPDLLILDVMLPGIDGLEICRRLRKTSTVPILMLTARAGEADKVLGLELGADDYVTKPFSLRELNARVSAMLRRAELQASEQVHHPPVVVAGDIEIDVRRKEVRRAGKTLQLKPKESQLLFFLARNPGLVFSRDQLLDRVWGYDFAGGTRTIDVHVRWVREKIEADPSSPRLLQTVRGTGYRFELYAAPAASSGEPR
jgi:DNA-binding response OmpR family regulator